MKKYFSICEDYSLFIIQILTNQEIKCIFYAIHEPNKEITIPILILI